MLDLETCKKLKEAGIEPQYQRGDWIYRKYKHGYKPHLFDDWTDDHTRDDDLWAMSLDQMLAEIKKRGYCWQLAPGESDYCIAIMTIPEKPYSRQEIYSDSPEEAVASALLWILSNEGSNNNAE